MELQVFALSALEERMTHLETELLEMQGTVVRPSAQRKSSGTSHLRWLLNHRSRSPRLGGSVHPFDWQIIRPISRARATPSTREK